MPDSPASLPRPARRSGRPAHDPRGQRRVSPNSPSWYLGRPAHVWVAVMSRRNASPRPEPRKAA
jgi:hypothetical protein